MPCSAQRVNPTVEPVLAAAWHWIHGTEYVALKVGQTCAATASLRVCRLAEDCGPLSAGMNSCMADRLGTKKALEGPLLPPVVCTSFPNTLAAS